MTPLTTLCGSDVLQPGEELSQSDHYLQSEPETVLWGRLPSEADRPVFTIKSGEEIIIDTLSHEGLLDDQGSDPIAFFGAYGVPETGVLLDGVEVAKKVARNVSLDGPHIVTGPIGIKGARPGDVLGMTLVQTRRRVPYGVISNRHHRGTLPERFPENDQTYSVFCPVETNSAGSSTTGGACGCMPLHPGGEIAVRFPLHPFLGLMGVATRGSARAHSVPPGSHGGNLDISLLTEGSTLFLPVQVPEALAYMGDPHFAQGDGEVALTAMEASLRVTVRFELLSANLAASLFGNITGPFAVTQDLLIPCGLGDSLDEALKNCVNGSVDLLQNRYGMNPALAYAYLSAAGNYHVSQAVDGVLGVHATIRRSDFGDLMSRWSLQP